MATRTRPDRPGAEAWVPDGASLDELATAAEACRGCELFAPATQVVFGAGNPDAGCLVVGEQPGAGPRTGTPSTPVWWPISGSPPRPFPQRSRHRPNALDTFRGRDVISGYTEGRWSRL
jgi:hypothetical protein